MEMIHLDIYTFNTRIYNEYWPLNCIDQVNSLLSIKNIAVVGVSREKGKFGNAIYKELKKKGFNTFGINPNLYEIEGDKCYSCLKDVQQSLEGVVTCLHPRKTASIVM